MRRLINILTGLLLCSSAFTQKSEKYYTWNWEPCTLSDARFVATIEVKDSLFLRQDYFLHTGTLQMKGQYRDKESKVPEGSFYYFYPDGKLKSIGSYVQGRKQGLWLDFYANGVLFDSAVYENDRVIGTRMKFHSNGYLADSSVWQPDGSGVAVRWFDNGSPSEAGLYAAGGKQHGKWQYFHRNGQLSAQEKYDNGELLSKSYFDEEGKALSDTTNKDRAAAFPGGDKAWAKYLLGQLYFPEQWKIVNSDRAVVVVDWVIDEEGHVTDIRVSSPFHVNFDRIAVQAIKKSPKWIPAFQHNRNVKAYRRQPVTFAQGQ